MNWKTLHKPRGEVWCGDTELIIESYFIIFFTGRLIVTKWVMIMFSVVFTN